MKVEISDKEKVPEIRVEGEIDHYVAPSLEKDILSLIESSPNKSLILNMTEVGYLDSAAIGVLFASVSQMKNVSPGKLIILVCPNENVKKILNLVGIETDPVFRLLDKKEQALVLVDSE